MITKKLWYTEKYNRKVHGTEKRLWTGWFLFGFIPLYIVNYEYTVI
jgi:hypothetical protein